MKQKQDERKKVMKQTTKNDGELNLNAVVRLNMVAAIPNYSVPWQTKGLMSGIGSGVVIDGKRILTNAHNVADTTFITVLKQNDDTPFEATVQAVDHECDLALLDVIDKSFFDDITPMEFGETPAVQTEVQVAGYPIGGLGVSVTQGIISRIEEVAYRHSDFTLMAAQLDAAINPGNSGGPVLYRNRIVGIAFQGMRLKQNIGYMIPMEVIRHFLKDLENGKVDGFGNLSFQTMNLDNPDMRRSLKMRNGQTGVLVYEFKQGTSHDGLELNDVLLSIDGHKIANSGNVRRPGERPRSLTSIVRGKQIGEEVEFKVLRKGQERTLRMPVRKSMPLCPAHLYDIVPRYFILGGFIFTPLTGNLLDEILGMDPYMGPDPFMNDEVSQFRSYQKQYREKPDDEVVMLHSVLGDAVNIGFIDCHMMEVKKVNGEPVRNLQMLAEAVDKCKSQYITFTMQDGRPITLDIQRLRNATPRILKRYRIAADRMLG